MAEVAFLLNNLLEGGTPPGYGAPDPVTHADTDGTYEDFVAAYGRHNTI